jgi:hypothetical protein
MRHAHRVYEGRAYAAAGRVASTRWSKRERIYVNPEGKLFNMSLSNTCLDCHSNKEKFCDRCHDYASVALLLGLPHR